MWHSWNVSMTSFQLHRWNEDQLGHRQTDQPANQPPRLELSVVDCASPAASGAQNVDPTSLLRVCSIAFSVLSPRFLFVQSVLSLAWLTNKFNLTQLQQINSDRAPNAGAVAAFVNSEQRTMEAQLLSLSWQQSPGAFLCVKLPVDGVVCGTGC